MVARATGLAAGQADAFVLSGGLATVAPSHRSQRSSLSLSFLSALQVFFLKTSRLALFILFVFSFPLCMMQDAHIRGISQM
jgi:hypothetical protein